MRVLAGAQLVATAALTYFGLVMYCAGHRRAATVWWICVALSLTLTVVVASRVEVAA